jgi:transcriptional regulator with XRE-family HTH domain
MSIYLNEEIFSFGPRLAAERNRLGLSQSVMAARAGKTARTVIKYETGETRPDAAFLLFLDQLGADIYYIVTGTRSANALSPDEDELLGGYRSLDVRGKAGVLALIGSMGEKGNAPRAVFHGNVAQVVQGNQTTKDVTFTVESGNKKKNLEHD